jgi:hypothetical protein
LPSDAAYKMLVLVCGQLAFVGRHFALAVGHNFYQLSIRKFLDIIGAQV